MVAAAAAAVVSSVVRSAASAAAALSLVQSAASAEMEVEEVDAEAEEAATGAFLAVLDVNVGLSDSSAAAIDCGVAADVSPPLLRIECADENENDDDANAEGDRSADCAYADRIFFFFVPPVDVDAFVESAADS